MFLLTTPSYPSLTLDLPRALLPDNQGYFNVYRGRRVGPRTTSITIDANLDCAFGEYPLVFVVLKLGGLSSPWSPCLQLYVPFKKKGKSHAVC